MTNRILEHLDKRFTPLTKTLKLEGLPEETAIKMRAAYVAKNIKENPNFECWDYISYYKSGTGELIRSEDVLISNRGRVCGKYRSKYKIYTGFLNGSHGHRRVAKIKLNGEYFDFTISRAVACLFVPLPKGRSYKDSSVKFKSGDKSLSTNLVWGSIGSRYGDDMRHVIGIVKVAGEWYDYRFALTDLVGSKCGIVTKKVRDSIKDGTLYKWCKWQVVTERTWKKYNKPFPKELGPLLVMNELTKKWLESTYKATFIQDRCRTITLLFKYNELEKFDLRLGGVKLAVGTAGVYKGLKWEIATEADIKKYGGIDLVTKLNLMEEIKTKILRIGGATRVFSTEWLRRKTQVNQSRV